MPFVHIEILEGLSDESKQEVVEEIVKIFNNKLDIPTEKVFVFFEDLKRNNYARNGKLVSLQDK